MKKINIRSYILGLVTALVFLAFPTSVFASPVSEMINVFYNNIKIVVDGKAAEFGKDSDGNDIQPFIYKGTTYLPVRAVGETLGKEVSWDGTTQTVYLGDKPEAKQTSKGDIEPNNTYQDASLVYTGDTITGTITDGDDDFYKIDIEKEGELTLDLLSLEGKKLSLYLYGEDYEKGVLQYFSSESKGSLNEGVRPGTYYIYVKGAYSSISSKYELDITYLESSSKDDGAGENFMTAKSIAVNKKITGNIGYKNAYNTGNYSDYYKIEVQEEGTLTLDLLSLESKNLSIYLYGEDYEKGVLQYFSSESKGSISDGLRPGIYYIYIKGAYSSTYSPYELNINYTLSAFKDDKAGNDFISAKTISANEKITGNIGYMSAYNTGNYSDYYKIVVPESGTLTLDLLSNESKKLSLYLYGEDYEKGTLEYFSAKEKGSISEGLQAGTYYIYIKGAYTSVHTPYELNVSFAN